MTHPTPPLVHFWAQRSPFSWVASLCLPLGRQSYWESKSYTGKGHLVIVIAPILGDLLGENALAQQRNEEVRRDRRIQIEDGTAGYVPDHVIEQADCGQDLETELIENAVNVEDHGQKIVLIEGDHDQRPRWVDVGQTEDTGHHLTEGKHSSVHG